ncbi:hypothetical protein LEP1GSC108_3561 [Leptospira weilii str. UI 13098]|uniref:Uncharacterized protein n=1 Tax=Leptospira weilii str. UI 13098 TaxID=1088542 RepID=M6QCE5_9LEPT|nr:hypothetical protein LEP1GSC108_3561 [Leptospira weilii str. UI 13098]
MRKNFLTVKAPTILEFARKNASGPADRFQSRFVIAPFVAD